MNSNCIAVIGPHGSGKTTAISRVRGILNDSLINGNPIVNSLGYCGEVSRLCPHKIGRESNVLAQSWIIRHQMMVDKLASSMAIPFLLDRCIIDQYAYYSYWVGPEPRIERFIIESTSFYSCIFLFPPKPEFLIHDGIRPVNPEFQSTIWDRICRIIGDLQLSHKVRVINIENVVEQILDTVKCIDNVQAKEQMVNIDINRIESNFGSELLGDVDFNDALGLFKEIIDVEKYSPLSLELRANVSPPHLELLVAWLEQLGYRKSE